MHRPSMMSAMSLPIVRARSPNSAWVRWPPSNCHEVEHGHQQPEPAGDHHRVLLDVLAGGYRSEDQVPQRAHEQIVAEEVDLRPYCAHLRKAKPTPFRNP